MVFNGSELLTDTWNTTFSPFSHFFGSGWLIIPVSVIAALIFIRTKDTAILGAYMVLSSVLLAAGGLFTGIGAEMVLVYALFTTLGLASFLYGVFYGGRQ